MDSMFDALDLLEQKASIVPYRSSDLELSRQPDTNQRMGRARLSLARTQSNRPRPETSHSASRPCLERLQANEYPASNTSLSAYSQAESPSSNIAPPSSPLYQASQRHQPHDQQSSMTKSTRSLELADVQLSPHFKAKSTFGLRFRSSLEQAQPPFVQGIQLVPVSDLPDRFRTLFHFVCFNAVQSRCFPSIYGSNENFVLSSPTGSGKTAIFELAICRSVNIWQGGTIKVVYMAPTKSLCAERKRDWKARFACLNLRCEELTGDSDVASLQSVQTADIIVTTPEKWDSMTRKWKDHEKLVRLIKLFLIDEVHILNKDRGAALEAVVSRMKSVGSDIRFVALSATVPNSQDIATWLGTNNSMIDIPAIRESFGEEFRPVKLQKHVCGYQTNSNAYAFDSSLNKKLPDVITKYSQKKPIMIFCFTRKSCSEAAKLLANWWTTSMPNRRCWKAPLREIKVQDKDLCNTISTGVAVHHAGLGQEDRLTVENAYLAGELGVLCCTSTLSVGVNLPCHMVIIKNTVNYEGNRVKEYSDLEIMQMVGRAGRPQFDDSAVAVIMTRLSQVNHYEQMVSGRELLESCLHLNLVEHLNAEIGLGVIVDLHSAKKWLGGTFLRVRLQHNPNHYQIEGDTNGRDLDERLQKICQAALTQLVTHRLVNEAGKFRLTPYGEAMARYYVNMTTMVSIVNIPEKPKLSEILSTLAQAYEFREIRLRAGEKAVYKKLNSSPNVRFPVKVDIAMPAHKVTLIIQSVLGGVDTIADDVGHKVQYGIDQGLIFQHVHRLIRCIVDCQAHAEDASGIRNALFLSRSFAAKAWDDSPMVLRQIDQVGPAAVRKLNSVNINSVDALERTQPSEIERIMSRNPPFGRNTLSRVKTFPRLTIAVRARGQPDIAHASHVILNLAVEIGYLNERVPAKYGGKPVYAIMLAETSDGQALHFCRISVQKMSTAAPILFTAHLTRAMQTINCYVMCDEIAGTLKQVSLVPDVPASAFLWLDSHKKNPNGPPTISKTPAAPPREAGRAADIDEWGDGGINDDEFVDVASMETGFIDIDELEMDILAEPTFSQKIIAPNKLAAGTSVRQEDNAGPMRLENGKWACNHSCKDKAHCKHLCCREGVDKKPKPKKLKGFNSECREDKQQSSRIQTKLGMAPKSRESKQTSNIEALEYVDLSEERPSKKAKTSVNTTGRGADLHADNQHRAPFLSSQYRPEARPTLFKSCRNTTEVSSAPDTFGDYLVDKTPDLATKEGVSDFSDSLGAAAVDDIEGVEQSQRASDSISIPDEAEISYLDDASDEDMLDAALVGAEDSHKLSSQSGLFQSGLFEPEDLSHSKLPLTQEIFNGSAGLALRPQSSTALATTAEISDKTRASPGTPELRAWLAAEIGDCVELVDSIE